MTKKNKEKKGITDKNKLNNTKLVGKKRKEEKSKGEKVKEINKIEDDNKDIELNMKQKELDKIDDLITSIRYNLDEILLKSEKYQKSFINECKEKSISIKDNKNLQTKIELVKYLQMITEIMEIPLKINNEIENLK